MSEQLSKLEKSVEDVLEIVVSMKDYMEKNLVTKAELSEELNSLEKRIDVRFEEVNSKIDGLGRRIDNEVENRAQIETRVRKVEEAVFPV